jgi:hypothetical protein
MKFSGSNIVRFNSHAEFLEYLRDHPEVLDSVSPGGAANRLGVTRQAIHNMMKRGKVRAWIVYDKDISRANGYWITRPSTILIPNEDIERYKAESLNKPGRKPKGVK